MKNVEVMEVRAMLKEILAVSGGKSEDVDAVMSIGTPAMGLHHLTGPAEISSVLAAVELASPATAGQMKMGAGAWRQLQSAYSQHVVGALFA